MKYQDLKIRDAGRLAVFGVGIALEVVASVMRDEDEVAFENPGDQIMILGRG
jgi:hypothetical protein